MQIPYHYISIAEEDLLEEHGILVKKGDSEQFEDLSPAG